MSLPIEVVVEKNVRNWCTHATLVTGQQQQLRLDGVTSTHARHAGGRPLDPKQLTESLLRSVRINPGKGKEM
jgi:hypothetical protein